MNTKRKTTTTPKQATKIIKKNTKTKTKASCARTHDAHRRARVFTTKHETEDIKGLLPEHGLEVLGTQQEHESTTKAQTVHGVEEHGYEEEAVDVGGRPSYLCDPAVEKQIFEHVSKGNYIDDACLACGIGESTLYQWIEFAQIDKGNGKNAESSNYVRFAEGLKHAHALATVRLMGDIDNSMTRDQQWTNKAWILERTRNRKFGQKQLIEIESDPLTANLDIPDSTTAPKPLGAWIQERRRIETSTPAEGTDLSAMVSVDVADLEEVTTENDS